MAGESGYLLLWGALAGGTDLLNIYPILQVLLFVR